jgi:mono/diheme cytochrome c family protein
MKLRTAVALGLIALGCGPATARDDGQPGRGRTFVQANCAGCHAIGLSGRSRLARAPAFRDLHLRYPVENLAEAFAEGIATGHPAMPEFQLAPGRVADLIAYLKTLER